MAKTKRIGEMLMEAGMISRAQLEGALARQKQWGGRLGSNLVLTGAIKGEDLRRFLASQTGVKEMDITRLNIHPEIIRKVPKKVVEQYSLIPLSMKDQHTLLVACLDPTDLNALDQVSFVTNHKVEPVIDSYHNIMAAIKKHYGVDDTIEILGTGDHMNVSSGMEQHGGVEAPEDPDLIIFGRDAEPRQAKAPAPAPVPPRPPEPEVDEFTLDFEPSWANSAPAPAPAPARKAPTPSGGSNQFTMEQKLLAMYHLLIKKGIISEAEIDKELVRLWSLGKLD